MKRLILLLASACALSIAHGEITTKTVPYTIAGAEYEGYLATPAQTADAPAVIVVPEWWGLNEYPKQRADQLAGMGYVAFAIDMYGKGKITTDAKQAGTWATEVRGNRPLMRERAKAGLEQLKKLHNVPGSRIAAIGYCFGGTTVLEMARDNMDVAGVASFHGALEPGKQVEQASAPTKPRVLVLNGSADPHVPAEQLTNFIKEMESRGADCVVVSYSGALHGFTNSHNKNAPAGSGMGYQQAADERSWKQMQTFFDELFKSGGKGTSNQ